MKAVLNSDQQRDLAEQAVWLDAAKQRVTTLYNATLQSTEELVALLSSDTTSCMDPDLAESIRRLASDSNRLAHRASQVAEEWLGKEQN